MSTKKPAFRLPPITSHEERRKLEQEFIQGAGKPMVEATSGAPTPPWEGLSDDRSYAYKPYLVRFSHREKRMLEFIEKNSAWSQHSFILSALRPAIEAEALKIWNEKNQS